MITKCFERFLDKCWSWCYIDDIDEEEEVVVPSEFTDHRTFAERQADEESKSKCKIS